MSESKSSPGVKAALEYGPIAAFFIGYMLLRERTLEIAGNEYSGLIVVTALFVPLLAITTFFAYRLFGTISKMQIVTLVIVVIFGGLTVWLNDERFIKMKPTMIYGLFAGVLGFGLLRGQSYLQLVMEQVLPLKDQGWMILTKRVALFFVALALLNEVIWRNFSNDIWVYFKTFGLTIGVFAFFMAQTPLFQRYSSEPSDEDT